MLDNPLDSQIYHMESMVNLLQKLEKSVEKDSSTVKDVGKNNTLGTLV